jgi:hypothetical protein
VVASAPTVGVDSIDIVVPLSMFAIDLVESWMLDEGTMVLEHPVVHLVKADLG